LSRVATRWSLGPACQRCPLDGKQRLPCCRPRGEAQHAGSPHAGVVIVGSGLRHLLPRKLLPLVLELCLSGLQIHLLSLQASCLLTKVVRPVAGTLVRRHELRGVVNGVVAIDVGAHVG
jgi:hypothetical protein